MKKRCMVLTKMMMLLSFISINTISTFASSPTKAKIESVASDGIDMFFGALAGMAVVFGGIEFVQAFLAYRESESEGGAGEANARIGRKIVAGILCLVAAILVFQIMYWTKSLFGLD